MHCESQQHKMGIIAQNILRLLTIHSGCNTSKYASNVKFDIMNSHGDLPQ